MGDSAQAIYDRHLAASDQADRDLQLRQAAWKDGYHAAQLALGDAWEDGYTAAQADFKALQHGTILDLAQHLRTWDGLRENFAQPRPGDYPGQEGAT